MALPDGLLVAVGSGGIEQVISGVDGVNDATLTFRQIRDLKNAKAENRRFHAVVEGNSLHNSSAEHMSESPEFTSGAECLIVWRAATGCSIFATIMM
jgi:hypothetical protein